MISTASDFFQSIFFDQDYYLAEKAAALNTQGTVSYDAAAVLQAIQDADMTPWQHYVAYGSHEYNAYGALGIDPSAYFSTNAYYAQYALRHHTSVENVASSMNTDPITDYAIKGYAANIQPVAADSNASLAFDSRADMYRSLYFNESEYLANKAAALNASGLQYTAGTVLQAIQNAGMTPWQHFCRYGAYEQDANGDTGIDPSQYFDVSRYYAVAGVTSIDPITHYALHGYLEGVTPVATDVSAVTGSPSARSVPLSGNGLIDSLLISDWSTWPNLNKIGQEQNNVLYYKFLTDNEIASYNASYDTSALTATQQTAYLQALNAVNQITGIFFAQASSASDANLLFLSAYKPGYAGSITLGWTETNESVWGEDVQAVILNDTSLVASNANPTFGNAGFSTVVHEIGHAMGLKHSFEMEAYNYAKLPDVLENTAWSMMSYTGADDAGVAQWYNDGTQYYSPLDILALNYLYGTDGLNGREGISYDDTILA
ncbi:MAG: hypothetical protein IJU65_04495 [Desulfovibrio sp.]|nr:hypothetical protein [Desulfovibrio sp.]